MLRHYLKMAARSLVRHKLYSFINVVGLSIALACATLILLFVRDQLSYDNWIPDTQNLYRLQVIWYAPGGRLLAVALSPFPVLNAMKAEIPGVQAVTHVVPEQMTIKAGDRQFLQTITVVDPNLLQVIKLPLVSGDLATETLAFIDRTWRSFGPETAISRYYLSAALESLFRPDEKQGVMLGLFVGIAIFIACLGLFGLAVFAAERRTKEIGIRKVSGARTVDIVGLKLWRISVPVLAANFVAWPLAYYYLHHWLQGYAYRISLDPIYFLAAGAAALLIAWVTVCAHALRLSSTSPIDALRYE